MSEIKADNMENGQKANEEGGPPRLDPKVEAYLQELLHEKHNLSTADYPHASRLMQEEVQRTQQTGRMTKDTRYADVYRERPIKVTVKVAVPIKEHPKFNFVGKLLGPKGNSLKRLQEETMCKMSILGRGSMKDKTKEEELRKGLDPKFAHLSDDLHIEVSALAPPAEAHARIAYALAEIRKFLIPDSKDDISMEQLREMENYLESSGQAAEDEPPHKRPMVRPVRGTFRGGLSNQGGVIRGQAPNAFPARPSKPPEEQYYVNPYSRSGGEGMESGSQFYRPDSSYVVSNESMRGRWKPSSVSGSSRFPPRSTPYFRPNNFKKNLLGVLKYRRHLRSLKSCSQAGMCSGKARKPCTPCRAATMQILAKSSTALSVLFPLACLDAFACLDPHRRQAPRLPDDGNPPPVHADPSAIS